MSSNRRQFLIAGGATLAASRLMAGESEPASDEPRAEHQVKTTEGPSAEDDEGESKMYGLISKIKAAPGQRDELIAILIEGSSGLPGCLSYIVAKDLADGDAFWVTEVWDNQASHRASLTSPSVQEAIAKGRPLIAGFEQRAETEPVGGHGLGG